jgi:hypothetical protein
MRESESPQPTYLKPFRVRLSFLTLRYPQDLPVSCPDLTATVFHSLGIDPHGFVPDKQGRPVSLAAGGRVVESVFS